MTVKRKVRRTGYLLATAAFALAIISAVRPQPAAAYALLSTRSIKMSSSIQAATNTDYAVTFTTVTNNQTIGSISIDFCSNSPIIGDSCTAPTGFDDSFATLAVNNLTGNVTGLSVDTTHSTSNHLVLKRTAAAVANGAVSFELGNGTTNGITNPNNTNTTFFARIQTLAATDGTGTPQDAGGVALSTANYLDVTAKVQETLKFCVYTGANCAAGGTAIALGDTNGVLSDTTTVYTNTASYDLASNALGGIHVKLKGATLTSGSFTITPSGTTCTVDSTASNTEQFGVRLSAVGAGQTAAAAYGCAAGSHAFDVANTNTTFGQDIATTAGATDVSSSTLELAAKAANTTEAGIYTTRLQLIATATY